MTGELIEKEDIDVTQITAAESAVSEDLVNKLLAAQRLGNEFKGKVTITFNTVFGPKKVSTTVWSATEKYIQLKGNVHIPISAIIDISL